MFIFNQHMAQKYDLWSPSFASPAMKLVEMNVSFVSAWRKVHQNKSIPLSTLIFTLTSHFNVDLHSMLHSVGVIWYIFVVVQRAEITDFILHTVILSAC